MNTKGQRLIELLQHYGVDTVFGIPGVHTVELYRGLGESNIQHITPRHEQGAGFMADGYARVTGKPGVCFVITGPGLGNIATAMGQALADSIPILVISTVNPKGTENMGCLHAMPHQQSMIKPLTVARFSIDENACLNQTMAQVFAALSVSNGTKLGPVHLQIPLDVMRQEALPQDVVPVMDHTAPLVTPPSLALKLAADVINNNDSIVILAGGGAVHAQDQVQSLADVLDAPVVTTINGRGLMANHPLSVPASPSLDAVRALLASAQCVIALGTEMGQTDYDMNVNGGFPHLANLIRIDINPALENNKQQLFIHGCVGHIVNALLPLLTTKQSTQVSGHSRAASTRQASMTELPANYQKQCRFLNFITSALPKATMVGDSTQPVYAGNCYFEANGAGTWFNSATGFGTLGYAVPAAVGAALGLRLGQEQKAKAANLVAITGDGGLQFCLAELATARDTGLPIIYLVWNNYGYGEIESSMLAVGVTPVGVSPKPPQLDALAQAYGLHYVNLSDINQLTDILRNYSQGSCPVIIEINEDEIMAQL